MGASRCHPYVGSKQPPRGSGQVAFCGTPCQRQIELRAASSLGQPRLMGRFLRAGLLRPPLGWPAILALFSA
jgi:hypothetical protein